MKAARGAFIVLEGPDKSGKSTQAALLAKSLKRRKIPYLRTRERRNFLRRSNPQRSAQPDIESSLAELLLMKPREPSTLGKNCCPR